MNKGNEEGRAIPPEGQEESEAGDERLSRGKFIAGAGIAGAGLVVGAIPGYAGVKHWTRQSRNRAIGR
jgi:hypothetical protein